MRQEEVVIRGGSVVTSYGVVEADVWISGGTIRRIAKDSLPREAKGTARPNEIDASGMYLLPGFVAMPERPHGRIRRLPEYLDAIRLLIRQGYTCLVDTLQPEAWMDHPQVRYQTAMHFNNLIDYTWQVELPASRLNGETVRRWCSEGYRLLRVVVRRPEELFRMDWETISPLLTSYKVMLQLRVPKEAGLNGEERLRLHRQWLSLCRCWQIRTWVDGEALLTFEEVDPYYHVFRLRGEHCERALRHLAGHWFRSLPVIAALDEVQVNLRRREWDPESLLCLLVRVASTNAAKAAGLYPRKGCIIPGADADILFLKKEHWLTKFVLSTILNLSDFLLPTSVMSKGKWLYRNQCFASTIGMGRCLLDIKPYNYVI
ncbi:amidohydrolase family protein [Brevibacillus sp. WF146]|uniref:amidohydrolase family protein n=1 Tax=Brevibacillus sp. WF146 TaxID=319501 RepID=UPI0007ED7F49|nr:amidohydrolase family protein [Brevibacillus sp. WF146]UYZ11750.1 amidohydrolase family protein [Brevibacillus sp. WF146]